MYARLFRWVELLPLAAFLAYARALEHPAAGMPWQGPFLLGGGLAVIATGVLLWQKRVLNRLSLGINLYLMTGAAAFLLQLWWLVRLYGQFKASGMLAWVIVVGVITLVWSPSGFIGVPPGNRPVIRRYSWYLLLMAAAAFIISWVFREHLGLAGALPFIGLYLGQSLLEARLTESLSAQNAQRTEAS
jgi:hypothetical protein